MLNCVLYSKYTHFAVFTETGNPFALIFLDTTNKKEANMNILTKTQADILKLTVPEREYYNAGELFPTIFDSDNDNTKDFKGNIPLIAKIIYFGNFKADSSVFPRIKCPVCQKEEALIPYFCGASILSGSHVIKFYCNECKELIAINNNSDYYHLIRDYLIKHKTELQTEPPTIIHRGKSLKLITKPQ